MSTERKGASFNPDDASGGFDKGRVVITKAVVDYFMATKGKNAGTKYVNLNLVFDRTDGGGELPVSLLIGSAEEWSPNSSKTEAIPTREDGKFWNKSDIYRFMVSLVNAGFPKARMGSDFSILVGLDVDIERVQTDGTHKDKEGKDRPNSVLLVTKVHTPAADLASGAYSKNVKASGGATAAAKTAANKPSTKVTQSSAPAAPSADIADYAKTLVIEILEAKGAPTSVDDVAKDAYIRITKAKRGSERDAILAALKGDALAALVNDGLVAQDGDTLSMAA